ncbi:MAG: hypothetical protein C4523_13055, partial [Myxococcales bacterium]
MKEFFRTHGIVGFLLALVGALLLAGCGGDTASDNTLPTPTVGSLNVNVNPADATVVVSGPESFTQTFTGNQLLIDLKPGQYAANAVREGYVDADSQINVVAGQTSSISIILLPPPTVGFLNVNVTPADATVVVTGPDSFSRSFTGNQFLADLTPGQYTAIATAPGLGDAASQNNVVAGQTSSISLVLLPPSTVGSLNVNVTPPDATVVVTGPDSFTQTFTGNQFLTDLASGQYAAMATAPGFVDAATQTNVIAGHVSTISLVLLATPIITEAPRAVYRDGQGNLIPLTSNGLQSGQFVFYAWLEDKPLGIVTTELTSTPVSDPGKPLVSEQMEYAPSFTQNLACAWVGYTDDTGVVRPVIGADVRWEIDQWWSDRENSMQFGASDDNRVALGYGVFDDQADTRTNNARLPAQR